MWTVNVKKVGNALHIISYHKPWQNLFEIFGFDFFATIEYGKIRAELVKKDTPVVPLDNLIAAHAKSQKPKFFL